MILSKKKINARFFRWFLNIFFKVTYVLKTIQILHQITFGTKNNKGTMLGSAKTLNKCMINTYNFIKNEIIYENAQIILTSQVELDIS